MTVQSMQSMHSMLVQILVRALETPFLVGRLQNAGSLPQVHAEVSLLAGTIWSIRQKFELQDINMCMNMSQQGQIWSTGHHM